MIYLLVQSLYLVLKVIVGLFLIEVSLVACSFLGCQLVLIHVEDQSSELGCEPEEVHHKVKLFVQLSHLHIVVLRLICHYV